MPSKALRDSAPLLWIGLGGAALGFVVAVALVGFPFGKEPVPRIRGPKPKPVEAQRPLPPPPGLVPPSSKKYDVEPLFPPPKPLPVEPNRDPFRPRTPPPVEMERARFTRLVAESNLAGIVLEVLQHRSGPEGAERLKARADEVYQQLRPVRRSDQERIFRDKARLYWKPGDRIVWFNGVARDADDPEPFVRALERWLQHFEAGKGVPCGIRRGEDSLQIYMVFMERSLELIEVAAHADLLLGASGTLSEMAAGKIPIPKDAPPGLLLPIPPALQSETKAAALKLHPVHREAIPLDLRKRAVDLAFKDRGTLDDLSFLRRFLDAYVLPFIEEYKTIKKGGVEAERKALGFAIIDIVDLKDGQRLGGVLIDAGPEWVVLETRTGSVRVPRYDVHRIKKGPIPMAERRRRFAEARGKPEALSKLAAWSRERGLKELAQLAWYTILMDDPGNRAARIALGLPPSPRPRF